MNPDNPNFNPGGVKDRVDLRDYQYSEIGFGTATFDWSLPYDVELELNAKLPVKDQGPSSSCGGQAWSYYVAVLEALSTGTHEERSAKYIYSQVYVPGGGSYGRDCANICVDQGVSREAVLSSYPNSELNLTKSGDITAPIREDAKLSKLLSYAQVGTQIDNVAKAIRANHGCVFGITGSNNGTWNSAFPKPPKLGDTFWRHWVYAGKAKLINGVKHIGILNSWGSNTGDKGWQWISETYFNTVVQQMGEMAIWSCWTHIFGIPIPPAFHHTFNVDLKFGQSGDEVKALQTALQIDGEFPLTVPPTGYFGAITEQAVKDFQKKYGIVTSGTPATTGYGRCGPKTRLKLNALFA